MLGLNDAAVTLGFYTVCVETKVNELSYLPLPCILHWNQNHFDYYSRNLIVVEGKHYFRATASIRSSGFSAQPGLDVFARIVVSDKTLWQQVFR